MKDQELRLRINAAAAKSGSRDFTRAIEAIKAAVRGLEKDTNGVFKRLKKSFDDASKSSKLKITGIDKNAIRSLQDYAKFLNQSAAAAKKSTSTVSTAGRAIRGLGEASSVAKTAIDALNKSLLVTNTALARQAQLASQARGAIGQVSAGPVKGRGAGAGARGGGRAADAQARATALANRETEKQISLQNRAQRALDASKLTVERLTISLAKVGAGASIRDVIRSYEDLQRSLGGTVKSTRALDNANTKFNSSIKTAQTSLTTLTARAKEEAAALKNATAATRSHAKTLSDTSKATTALAGARSRLLSVSNKQVDLELRTSAALRSAEQEVARLTSRMRGLGDTKGISAINSALMQLRGTLNTGVTSTLQLRKAVGSFAAVTSKAKTGISQMSSAQSVAAKSARTLTNAETAASRQARLLERDMRSAAGASNAASGAFKNATGGLRGLENAFSSSFQAGSAFRALIGSITIGSFVKQVFTAGDALDQFGVTMEVASDGLAEAQQQFKFVEDLARNFGTGLQGTRQEYAKFAIASDIAGVSLETTQRIFGSVSKALTVLGRGTEDQRLAFLALEQMMSKGTVSSEELRRQLGERLPGAVNLMAEAVGVSTAELQKMLKAGEVISAEVLPKFADVLEKRFGPGINKALGRAGTQFRIFQAEAEKALEAVAKGGFTAALAGEFRDLVSLMRGPDVKNAAESLGKSFAVGAKIFGTAAKFVLKNITEIGVLLKAIFIGAIVKQVALLAQSFLIFGQNAAVAASALVGLQTQQAASGMSTSRNTTLTALNTAALSANEIEHLKIQAAINGHTLVLTGNTAKVITNTTAMGAQAAAATGMIGAFGKIGKVFGVAGRVIGAVSVPLALLATGLSFIPSLFRDTADSAEDAASTYENAVSRMRSANATLLVSANEVLSASPLEAALRNASESVATIRETQAEARRILSEDIPNINLAGLEDTTRSETVKNTIIDFKDLANAFLESAKKGKISAKELSEFLAESAKVANVLTTVDAQEQFRTFGKALDPVIIRLTTLTRLSEEFTSFDLSTKNVAEAQVELGNLVNTVEDANREVFNLASSFSAALSAENLSGTARDMLLPILRAVDTFDNSEESVNKFVNVISVARNQVADLGGISDRTRTALNNFLDEMTANVKVAGELEGSVAAASISVDAFGRVLVAQTAKTEGLATSMRSLLAAIDAVGNAQSSISKIGVDAIGGLNKEIRLAGLSDRDRAIQTTLDSALLEDKAFIKAMGALTDARALLSNELIFEGMKENLRDVVGIAEADIAAIKAKIRGLAGILFDASKKKKRGKSQAVRDAEREQKELDKLAEASTTTAGALLELSRIEELLNSKTARATLTMKERNALFAESQKLAVEEIAENAGLAASFQTLGQLFDENTSKMIAAQKVRAANVALIRETGAGLNAETQARLRNAIAIDLQKEAQDEAIGNTKDFIDSIREENMVLELLNTGMFENKEIASQVIALTRAGINVNDEMIQSLNNLSAANVALTKEAANPAKAWLDAVPDWRTTIQQIETDLLDGLSNAFVELAETGKFSFEDMINGLISSATKAVSAGAIKELLALFNLGEDGFGLADIFGIERGDSVADAKAAGAEGGAAAAREIAKVHAAGGKQIAASLTQATTESGQDLQSAIVAGSQQGAELFRAALAQGPGNVAPGGAGGGAGLNNLLSGLNGAATPPPASIISSSRPGNISGSVADQIKTAGKAAGENIGKEMTTAGEGLGGLLSNVFGEGVAGFSGIFAGIGGALGGAIGGAKGAGIGGLIGSIFPMVISALGFKAGGLTSSPTAVNMSTPVPAALFSSVPSYADGTANTSGIPAMLHENEAVIPLTGNRKVPVEMGKAAAQPIVVTQNFNFPNSDADSFRRSRGQVASDAALVANQAMRKQT